MAAGQGTGKNRRDIVKPVRKLVWSAMIVIGLILAVLIGFWARPLSYFNALTYVQLRLAGAHSAEVTVGGYRLHYYVMGPSQGSPVVLVHGLGGRCEDWRNLGPYLVRAGFRVYMPDLPGFGRSDRPADFSYSIPDQAATVVAFMDAMGLKQVDLGGWSMGGLDRAEDRRRSPRSHRAAHALRFRGYSRGSRLGHAALYSHLGHRTRSARRPAHAASAPGSGLHFR